MTFDQDDVGNTYVYTIKEVAGDAANYSYDAEIYTMTVIVSEADGKIQLDVTYTNLGGEAVDKACFTNIYDEAEQPTPTPSAKPTPTPTVSPSPSPSAPPTPKTGDDSPLRFWLIVMVLSAVCLVAVFTVYRRKRKVN